MDCWSAVVLARQAVKSVDVTSPQQDNVQLFRGLPVSWTRKLFLLTRINPGK